MFDDCVGEVVHFRDGSLLGVISSRSNVVLNYDDDDELLLCYGWPMKGV